MGKLKTGQATSSLSLPQQLGLGLTMVRVSTVSIVYNLRMDHYGVRKCINNGDTSFPHILSFLSSLKSNQSSFQLHWSKIKVVSSIQTYPSKKPSVGSAYPGWGHSR